MAALAAGREALCLCLAAWVRGEEGDRGGALEVDLITVVWTLDGWIGCWSWF